MALESPAPAALYSLSSCPHLQLRPCKLCRRQVVQRTVGTLFVVIPSPTFDLSPRVSQAGEPVRIEAFVAQSAVEAFCVGVLCRLAGLNKLQPHPALFAPGRQRSTAKLRPIVQQRWLPAALARWPADPGRDAPAARPARYRPRSPDIPACNHPRWSTSESLSRCSRNHSQNPSTSVHSASWRLDSCLPRHSSDSAVVAGSSSPILLRGTVSTRACDWPAFLPAPTSPLTVDIRTACVWLPVLSAGLAMQCHAPLSALDNDTSTVPIPVACRRAAHSSGTRLPHSSRLPEVPQALPVF